MAGHTKLHLGSANHACGIRDLEPVHRKSPKAPRVPWAQYTDKCRSVCPIRHDPPPTCGPNRNARKTSPPSAAGLRGCPRVHGAIRQPDCGRALWERAMEPWRGPSTGEGIFHGGMGMGWALRTLTDGCELEVWPVLAQLRVVGRLFMLAVCLGCVHDNFTLEAGRRRHKVYHVTDADLILLAHRQNDRLNLRVLVQRPDDEPCQVLREDKLPQWGSGAPALQRRATL